MPTCQERLPRRVQTLTVLAALHWAVRQRVVSTMLFLLLT
jgi:hypothetical protein